MAAAGVKGPEATPKGLWKGFGGGGHPGRHPAQFPAALVWVKERRMKFTSHLRELGVAANATPKMFRGQGAGPKSRGLRGWLGPS